jgi:hypothetical protein
MKEERDVDKMKGERERDKIGSDFFWGMGKHLTGPDRCYTCTLVGPRNGGNDQGVGRRPG